MWKIAICDDEAPVRAEVRRFLTQLQTKHNLELELSCFGSGESLLNEMDRDTDLLILDIRMDGLSGMNAARLLRERGLQTCIIFLTTMVQYALQGYEVHAYSFIQKPLFPQQFERVVLEALKSQRIRRENSIVLQKGFEWNSIPIGNILYVEISDHTSVVVTAQGREEYNITLGRLTQQLGPSGFGLCHKSCLVNYRQIKSIRTSELTMANGEVLPLSKRRRKQFMEDYTKYMGGLL